MQTKDYISYKVKSGDTLKSLALRIGLNNYKQLRLFHNKVCLEIEHLKTEELIKGQVLYVPDAQIVNLINKNNKNETIEKENAHPFRLQLQTLNASYAIEIIKEDRTGDTKTKNAIAYTLDLQFLENDENLNILKIDKTNFLINKKQPATKMQQLALQCSKSYYPIHLLVNKNSEIVGIQNTSEIKERWLKNKASINEFFTGHYAEKYISTINYKLLKSNQLEDVLKNDLVLNTILLPYKRANRTIETTFNSTFFKHNINFKITQNSERDKINQDIILTQEGFVDDPRSYKELLDPESAVNNPFFVKLKKIEGVLNNTFTINMERGISKNISALYKVDYTPIKSKETTVTINLVNN